MLKAKGSWTKIAALTATICCCLGLVYGFCVWFDKHYYIRFGQLQTQENHRRNLGLERNSGLDNYGTEYDHH
jgi:hypothetical protein